MKSSLYVGLVHYPIYDKNFNVIATAITNYDLHDISRSAKTYGVKKYSPTPNWFGRSAPIR